MRTSSLRTMSPSGLTAGAFLMVKRQPSGFMTAKARRFWRSLMRINSPPDCGMGMRYSTHNTTGRKESPQCSSSTTSSGIKTARARECLKRSPLSPWIQTESFSSSMESRRRKSSASMTTSTYGTAGRLGRSRRSSSTTTEPESSTGRAMHTSPWQRGEAWLCTD